MVRRQTVDGKRRTVNGKRETSVNYFHIPEFPDSRITALPYWFNFHLGSRFLWISAWLLFGTGAVVAQPSGPFVTAKVTRQKVFVEEPLQVKIKAHSPTWFAEPLTIDNLNVSGAFLQSFKRTQSGMTTIERKKFATLEFFYILFPYEAGELTFPELTITTSIPPEGDYKGKPVTLKTKPITITVEPVPRDMDEDRWLVATDVRVSNRWSTDLSRVKVGDVITRTITVTAAGTLPSFIDAPDIGTVDFASVYSSEPVQKDLRDNKQARGRRKDTWSYLLEEEGSFALPEVEVQWWNPYTKRLYSRKIASAEIQIAPNDDMSSLTALRDSLRALNAPLEEEVEEAKLDYMLYLRWTAMVVVLILVLRLLYGLLLKVIRYIRQRRVVYRDSERYWFDRLLRQKGGNTILSNLYHWVDRSSGFEEEKTLTHLAHGDPEWTSEMDKLKRAAFQPGQKEAIQTSLIKKKAIQWRRRKKASRKKKPKGMDLPDLNP